MKIHQTIFLALTVMMSAVMAVDASWECEMCIVTGNTYCQKDGIYKNFASTYPTYSNDANMQRQCCDKTNGCGNWGSNGVPAKSNFECSDVAPDLLSALMTCPFMQNRCAAT